MTVSRQLPEATLRFVERAREAGLRVDPTVFPEGTRTATEAAAAIGCEVGAIVKSLLFMVDRAPVVVLMAGDRRVDTARLPEALGSDEATRASLDEVRAHTGFAAGGTPPLGHPAGVRVVADRSILRFGTVWAAAGTSTTVFPAVPSDLVSAAAAGWIDVAETEAR